VLQWRTHEGGSECHIPPLDFFVMIYYLHGKKIRVCDKSKMNIPPFKKAEHATGYVIIENTVDTIT
jgi:hypothetical protein